LTGVVIQGATFAIRLDPRPCSESRPIAGFCSGSEPRGVYEASGFRPQVSSVFVPALVLTRHGGELPRRSLRFVDEGDRFVWLGVELRPVKLCGHVLGRAAIVS
jgi:hypothetical protein